jgi:hypothetical protein
MDVRVWLIRRFNPKHSVLDFQQWWRYSGIDEAVVDGLDRRLGDEPRVAAGGRSSA